MIDEKTRSERENNTFPLVIFPYAPNQILDCGVCVCVRERERERERSDSSVTTPWIKYCRFTKDCVE